MTVDKAPATTPPQPKPKTPPKSRPETIPVSAKVVDIKSGKTVAETSKTIPEKTIPEKKQTSPKPRGSRARSGMVAGKVQLPTDLKDRIKDREKRFLAVEYLVRLGPDNGGIKPTNAAIRRLGIGDEYTKQYIERLVSRGIITPPSPGKAGKVKEVAKLSGKVDKFERMIGRAA